MNEFDIENMINNKVKRELCVDVGRDDSNYFIFLLFYYEYAIMENNASSKQYFELIESESEYYFFCLGLFADNQSEKLSYLEKSLSILKNPSHWLFLELFYAYQGIKDYLAWEYLEKAIHLKPNLNQALLEYCYFLDPVDNCIEIIQKLNTVTANHRDYIYFYFIGFAYLNCGNFENSSDSFHSSIEIEKNAEAYYGLALINDKMDNITESLRLYQISLDLDLKPDVLVDYAWLLFEAKRYDMANITFQKLLEIKPDEFSINHILLYYNLSAQFDEARKFLNGENSVLKTQAYLKNGWELIIRWSRKIPIKDELTVYKKMFGEEACNWLVEQINYISANNLKS